jgi:hypothetical protein
VRRFVAIHFYLALGFSIRKAEENHEGLKLNKADQLLLLAGDS